MLQQSVNLEIREKALQIYEKHHGLVYAIVKKLNARHKSMVPELRRQTKTFVDLRSRDDIIQTIEESFWKLCIKYASTSQKHAISTVLYNRVLWDLMHEYEKNKKRDEKVNLSYYGVNPADMDEMEMIQDSHSSSTQEDVEASIVFKQILYSDILKKAPKKILYLTICGYHDKEISKKTGATVGAIMASRRRSLSKLRNIYTIKESHR